MVFLLVCGICMSYTNLERAFEINNQLYSSKANSMFSVNVSNYDLGQYSLKLQVGSGNIPVSLVLDTSLSYMWVPSSNCVACHQTGVYDCNASTSCTNENKVIGTKVAILLECNWQPCG